MSVSTVQVPPDATKKKIEKKNKPSNSKLNWKTPSKKLADESDLITRLGAYKHDVQT